ncbi:MAG: hypothetical protein OHK0017_12880 [Patescibacteria group bacterium]
MPVQVFVPDPVRHKPETEAWQRRLRKWILYIGIPLIIAAILIGGYMVTHKAKPVAGPISGNVKPVTPKANIEPNLTLNDLKLDKESVAANHSLLIKSLQDYDKWNNIANTDQCYSGVLSQLQSRTSWKEELSTLNGSQRASYLDAKVKLESNQNLLKENQATLNWLKDELALSDSIEEFIAKDEAFYQSWSKSVEAITKLCQGTNKELSGNCLNLNLVLTDYEKTLKDGDFSGITTSISKIKAFCDNAQKLVDSNNLDEYAAKLREINPEFKNLISTYPQSSALGITLTTQITNQTDASLKL